MLVRKAVPTSKYNRVVTDLMFGGVLIASEALTFNEQSLKFLLMKFSVFGDFLTIFICFDHDGD